MKSKKILTLTLLGLLSFGGVKVYAEISENTMSKNKLMTEKISVDANDKKDEKISAESKDKKGEEKKIENEKSKEDQLKEIVLNDFENYFDKKIDVKDWEYKSYFVSADAQWNIHGEDYYCMYWVNGEKCMYSNITADGEVFDIKIYTDTDWRKVTLIELEEAKKIAFEFIKEKELVENIDELEFLGEATIGSAKCGIVYKYGEDKGIIITVDSGTKEVIEIEYMSETKAMRCVENTDYRESGICG